jgi:hypothetical protein
MRENLDGDDKRLGKSEKMNDRKKKVQKGHMGIVGQVQ